MTYLLDSNTLIEAKNHHYRFPVVPGYWDWILRENANGVVFSIQAVQKELTVGTDDLATWAASQSVQLFLVPDAQVTAALSTVATWVNAQPYQPNAISTFLNCADFWLVAHALAHRHCVVTRETPDPGSRKRVKIPDVCNAVTVLYTNPFQMLEDEGAVFKL